MDQPISEKGGIEMKCSVKGCPGMYEEQYIIHTVNQNGEIFVFEHVPAEVCSVCGDTLFKPETVRHIEELIQNRRQPQKLVPVYEYA